MSLAQFRALTAGQPVRQSKHAGTVTAAAVNACGHVCCRVRWNDGRYSYFTAARYGRKNLRRLKG